VRYVMPLTLRHSTYAPGDTEAFSAYCRTMAEQFGGHIAMWDLPRCTKDPVTGYVEDYVCPADEYIAKFNAMREAISAVQPGAKFAATGLLLSNPGDLDAILQAIGGEADLIGVMPASQNLLGVVHFGQRPSLGQLGPALDRLQEDFPEAQLCVEYRPAALADSPHVGAADIARTFIKLQNRGVITGLSMSQGYSLLDDFADPRQAFYALRLLATLYDGGLTPLADAPVRVSDARVLQWTYETDKGALLAAWMPYYENRAVDLQLPAGTKSVVAYDPMTSTSQQLRVTNGAEGPVAEDVLMSHSPCVYLVDTGAESAR